VSRKDYVKPWVETVDLRERLDSMTKVIRLILDDELHPSVVGRLYKEMTWEATELGKKLAPRYRSVGALHMQDTLPVGLWKSQVTHEHVVPRKELRLMLSRCHTDDEIRRVLQVAQGCLILRAEHKLLDDTKSGWLRYLGRVEVIDMLDRQPADLRALASLSV
jgi:hypothetical protein